MNRLMTKFIALAGILAMCAQSTNAQVYSGMPVPELEEFGEIMQDYIQANNINGGLTARRQSVYRLRRYSFSPVSGLYVGLPLMISRHKPAT